MRSLLLPASTLLFVVPLAAQHPIADSAAVARSEWQAAAAALQSGDSSGALAALIHASHAWPTQPAYALAVARLAARTGSTDAALAALADLDRLGASWMPTDPAFRGLASEPRYRQAEATMRDRTAPLERSRVLWALPDTDLQVEGVAADPRTGRWFISSVRQRKVLVRHPDGTSRDFITTAQDGLDAPYGLAVDSARGLLWVAASSLFGFDLETGILRAKVALPPAAAGHLLGEVIVAPDGTLFASDSRHPAVYRIRPGRAPAVAEVVVEGHPLFRSLQGMVPTEDGRALYLGDYSHGLMWVDLATGAVTPLRGPPEGTLLGLDGLARGGPRTLIGVQNGIIPCRVLAIHLDAAGTGVERVEVLDRPPFGEGEPTLGVRVGNSFAYVATLPAVLRLLPLEP